MNQASSRGKKEVPGLGSGGRLVAGLFVGIVVVAGIGWFSLSGRLAGLQYANVPLVRPYPPPGHFVNPYTGDPRDILSSAEASKVKRDFLSDGQIQLDAYARGDPSALPQTATGRALAKTREVLAQNTANGVLERDEVHLDQVIVGRLADPNDTSINWCVREVGRGALVFVSRSSGKVVSRQAIRFDSKYWMSRVGDKYLIADVLISSRPEQSA